MKKQIVILFLFLLSKSILWSQEVKVLHNLPPSLINGQNFDWEITIQKGTIGGFAKIQFDIPSGFGVEAIDIAEGTFTFESDKAKVVWVSMPATEAFKFRLRLHVPKNTFSAYMMTAKFHYLQNNVKKECEMKPFELSIVEPTGAVTDNHVHTDAPGSTVKPENTAIKTVQVQGEASDIKNTQTVQTPKITEEVVSEVKVTEHAGNPTKVVVVPPTIDETHVKENSTTQTVQKTNTSEPTQKATAVAQEVKKTEAVPVITTVNTPVTEALIYKVQLGSFAANPGKSKFPGIPVEIKQEEGKFKVYAGNFKTHEEAAAYKNELQKKGQSGFIVKFQGGHRVK